MAVKLRQPMIKNLLHTKDKQHLMMKIKTILILHSVAVVFHLNKVDNYFDSMSILSLSLYSFQTSFSIRYLKEIGYVDTIIDIRSTAVKKLLGIKSETNVNGDNKPTNEPKKYVQTTNFQQNNDNFSFFVESFPIPMIFPNLLLH